MIAMLAVRTYKTMRNLNLLLTLLIALSSAVSAFVVPTFSNAFVAPRTFRPATKLFLEDHIADL
jgi:hypothetical protein